jgi:ABC-type polysaccharide transport system, permease component
MFEKNELIKNTIKNKGLLLLAIPGLIFLLAFFYLPMVGIIIPFKNINYTKGILGSDWAGLDNFKFLFSSNDILRATTNTIISNLLFIVVTLIFSMAFALMLYELSHRAVKIYQTSMFIPYFLSWVVVSYIVYAFLNPEMGIVNQFLKDFGVEAVNWYSEPKYWRIILLVSYLWKNVGYYTILYYTALMGIDSSYFEVSAIDGATKLQQIRKISIPLVSPIIMLLVLLQIGRIFFSDFGLFYFIPKDSGAIYSVTDVIDTYVFRSLKNNPDLGMTAAAGLYQTVVGFILVVAVNRITKKFNSDLAIF